MGTGMGTFIIIGLDGFDPHLARHWMASGNLPNLKTLADRGWFTSMKSTVPPFTYPAWSSLITGENPGVHGMIDFAVRQPGSGGPPNVSQQPGSNGRNHHSPRSGSYRVQYINSTFRKCPTIFKQLSEAGKRVCAMGFPTTYPPEPVNGIMIAGFDSPLAVTADSSFCHPPELWNELKSKVHPYTLAGIQELKTGRGWHRTAAETILETVRQRTAIAEYLLQKEPWDLFAVVFSESDTTAHHFWAAHDPESPRHAAFQSEYGDTLSGFLKRVYRALDTAVGRLLPYAEHVVIVSDHGSGGTGAYRLSLNRIMERRGAFRYRNGGTTATSGSGTGWIKRIAQHVPAQFGQWLFRHGPGGLTERLETRNRLQYVDLPQCRAFSDELNYFPSIWIHDERFPEGHAMKPAERDHLCEDITRWLLQESHPDTGAPVVAAVHRRESLFDGPAMDIIPDLIVEPALDREYSYAVWNAPCPGPAVEAIPEDDLLGRKGGSMNGSHRPYGVLFTDTPKPAELPEDPDIIEVGRYLMRRLGLNTAKNPSRQQSRDYTPEQEAAVEKRLRDLGYLD